MKLFMNCMYELAGLLTREPSHFSFCNQSTRQQVKQGIAQECGQAICPHPRWQFDGGKNRGGSTCKDVTTPIHILALFM